MEDEKPKKPHPTKTINKKINSVKNDVEDSDDDDDDDYYVDDIKPVDTPTKKTSVDPVVDLEDPDRHYCPMNCICERNFNQFLVASCDR